MSKKLPQWKIERENILSALGEHPESPVDIPQRVSDIRDEGRAHFHNLTKIQETVAHVLELMNPAGTDKDLEHAVRNKLQVILTLQGNAESDAEQLEKAKAEYDPKHPRTCDCHGCRRFRRAFTPNPDRPIYLQLDDEKRKVRDLASEVCRLNAQLSSEISRRENREQLEARVPRKKKQPLALACTKCGSTIHSDSYHSERCPQGYR